MAAFLPRTLLACRSLADPRKSASCSRCWQISCRPPSSSGQPPRRTGGTGATGDAVVPMPTYIQIQALDCSSILAQSHQV
ncbi:hypothetical protein BJV78DRAFT_1188455, partial [Lactifluus subvellereus]